MLRILMSLFLLIGNVLYAQNKISLNVGGNMDVLANSNNSFQATPFISLSFFDRVEIGGFSVPTSKKYHSDLFVIADQSIHKHNDFGSDRLVHSFLKVYLGRDRNFTLSFGGINHYKTEEKLGLITAYRETTILDAFGMPIVEQTNELERIPQVNDVSIGYFGIGYNMELFPNLYFNPELRYRAGEKTEKIYHTEIFDQNDEYSIDNRYTLANRYTKFSDFTFSISVSYRFGLLKNNRVKEKEDE